MKSSRLFAMLTLVTFIFAFAPFMPATANAAHSRDQQTITGTLVATPQNALPATLLLQTDAGTVAVNITASTDIDNGNGAAVQLSNLNSGDQLQVTGTTNSSGGIDASVIHDLSVSGSLSFTATGTLAQAPSALAAPAILCLAKAQMTSSVSPNAVPAVSSCPTGELPISVTSSTKLFRREWGTSALFEFQVGDTLEVSAVLANGVATASQIRDTSIQAADTQFTGTVQTVAPSSNSTNIGVMVSKTSKNAPFQAGATLTLPVLNASSPNCVAPSATQFPCPVITVGATSTNGLTGTDVIVGNTIGTNGLWDFQLNQFVWIKAIKVAAPPAQVITGTLVAAPTATLPATLLLQVGASTVSVNVTASTDLDRANDADAQLSDLHIGDQLQVTGTPNTSGGIDASIIHDLALVAALPFNATGTLAQAPSALTAPAILCLAKAQMTSGTVSPNAVPAVSPCPTGELPISATSSTKLFRREWGTSALFEFQVGDTLEVSSVLANGVATASQIRDTSIQAASTQFTGTVQTVTANGNATSVAVTAATTSNGSPFSVGAALTLPVLNSTSPNCATPSSTQFPCTAVTANGTTTNGYSGSEIVAGNTVTADGLYDFQLGQFVWVRAVSVAAPAPVVTSVAGNLAAAASQATAPVTLCLLNASVTGTAISPNVVVASPCPNGQMPVYVVSTTAIVRSDNSALPLSQIAANDKLQISGNLANGQFTATTIEDLTAPVTTTTATGKVFVQLEGRITKVQSSGKNRFIVVKVTQVLGNAPFKAGVSLGLSVQTSTGIMINGHRSNTVHLLRKGDTVMVEGMYNISKGYFVSVSLIEKI